MGSANSRKNFEEAKRRARLELDRVLQFLRDTDASVDSKLEGQILKLKEDLEALQFDPASIVSYALPVSGSTGYGDLRIRQLFQEAFPSGHKYHKAFERYALAEMAKLRKDISRLSN